MNAFILSMLACLILFGCSSNESDKTKGAGEPIGADDDTLGPADLAIDPVSDVPVATDAAWKTYWHGSWYYFDSEENLRKFESDPTTYVRVDGRRTPERYKIPPQGVH